jgi:hypothetical protein
LAKRYTGKFASMDSVKEYSLADTQRRNALQALHMGNVPPGTEEATARAYFETCLDAIISADFLRFAWWNNYLQIYKDVLNPSVSIDIDTGEFFFEENTTLPRPEILEI